MRVFARAGAVSPDIRTFAAHLVQPVASRDYWDELKTVSDYVRDQVRFVRDPVAAECVQTPEFTLRHGYGDCDDKATLLAALAMSIGAPVRFVAIGATPSQFAHVYVEIRHAGQWIPAETASPDKAPFGRVSQAAGAYPIRLVVPVSDETVALGGFFSKLVAIVTKPAVDLVNAAGKIANAGISLTDKVGALSQHIAEETGNIAEKVTGSAALKSLSDKIGEASFKATHAVGKAAAASTVINAQIMAGAPLAPVKNLAEHKSLLNTDNTRQAILQSAAAGAIVYGGIEAGAGELLTGLAKVVPKLLTHPGGPSGPAPTTMPVAASAGATKWLLPAALGLAGAFLLH